MASREQDTQFQIFKFHSVINVYDARLKKNILIPVDQNWSFAKYHDARFGFKIESTARAALAGRRLGLQTQACP